MEAGFLPDGVRHKLATLGRGALHLPDARVIDPVMDELEALLVSEGNYLQEAAAMQWFSYHAPHPQRMYAGHEPLLAASAHLDPAAWCASACLASHRSFAGLARPSRPDLV